MESGESYSRRGLLWTEKTHPPSAVERRFDANKIRISRKVRLRPEVTFAVLLTRNLETRNQHEREGVMILYEQLMVRYYMNKD